MKLDYSSLESAVAQLQRSFDYLHSDLARKDDGLREQFRAATIQAFEFSYELAVRMIRRQLVLIVANPDEWHLPVGLDRRHDNSILISLTRDSTTRPCTQGEWCVSLDEPILMSRVAYPLGKGPARWELAPGHFWWSAIEAAQRSL